MEYNVYWKFPNGTNVSVDDDDDDLSNLDIDESVIINNSNNNSCNEQTVADSLNMALLHMSIHDITCHFESDTGMKIIKMDDT